MQIPLPFFLTAGYKTLLVRSSDWLAILSLPSPPKASQTPSYELPGGDHLRLQQPDIRGRSLGPAHTAGV